MPRFETANPSPEPAEPQAVFSQKPKMPLKLVFFAILGLLLVSGIAYGTYWYGKQQVPPPTPEVTPPPTAPVVEGWQVYSDPEVLRISLEFPADWIIIEEGHLGKSAPTFTTPAGSRSIDKHFGSLSVSRQELSSRGPDAKLEDTFDLDETTDSVLNEDQVVVGGEKALRKVVWEGNYYRGSTGETGRVRKHIRVLHGGFVYRILYDEEIVGKQIRSPEEWQLDSIFDHILSTFRFLE